MVARVLLIGVLFVAATGVVDAVAFDRTGLLSAIDACLAVNPTGVECCSAGADCGVAGTLEMPDWNVSGITNMADLFKNGRQLNDGSSGTLNSTQFNANISRWDTSSVTDMKYMFDGASAFNADISGWDTSLVTDSVNMFQGATAWLATYGRKDGTASNDGPPTAWHIPPCTCCQEKMMSMGFSTGRQCIPQP